VPNLREEVVARYVSTSAGIHRPCGLVERNEFVSAYQWLLRDWLPTNASLSWLDLGCGQGQLMSLAHAMGFRNVLGIDLSAEMLAACREVGLNVRLGDAIEFVDGLSSEAFDIVSAFDFVEHLARNDAFALLRDARRVLRPGGLMFIKVPNAASPHTGEIFFSDLTHESMWTPASMAQLAALAGFARCEVREVPPVPHGIRSSVRYVLWKCVRYVRRLVNAVETGSLGPDVITRVMLVRLTA